MSRLHGSPSDIAEQIQNLHSCCQRIEAVQNQMSNEQLANLKVNKGRTPLEILAHLRSCADIWSYSIYAILATRDQPILAQINAHKWTDSLGYTKIKFASSFQIFKINRSDLLRVLRTLPSESWDRTARIGDREHSIYSQARRMSLHEVSHCQELESIAKLNASL